ncbi:hypothetical protein MVES1_003436 [Malassezia vespertilionis]|uniref:Uncharacterized protein n=1 Tax=Malassezia vespertilionis TaxID=2020962 RepID=A0A2N1J7C7_9BASI|nr:uncharacterized protein MVES1_003436 [Malassezia vespertilionis]PKI82468.1 hypothetical protein MVES_003673 [Malassezia vespertilionis]WFD08067.1 hypothetical protein MVES1_003436 [Malassezia vespertilionis]
MHAESGTGKHPILSQRATYRAMTLDFRARAQPVLGGERAPLTRYAPPVALAQSTLLNTDTTAAIRESREQLKKMYTAQVVRGDYGPYKPRASLSASFPADAPSSVSQTALLDADQAMHANTSLHPAARRFVVQQIAKHLGIAS